MAEAIAAIGLASALLTFIDFGAKVIRRLRQVEDHLSESSSYFRNVRVRLPLMMDLVKKIMLQMEAGLVPNKSEEVMYPVVNSCIAQAQELDKLFDRILPQAKDGSWTRGMKAIYSVLSESEVERIDSGMKSNFGLLMQAGTFQTLSRQGNSHTVSIAPTFTLAPTVHFTVPQQQESQATPMPWEEMEKHHPLGNEIFLVPFSRDADFLGRRSVIEGVSGILQKSQIVALSGLGAIGKSQIAIEYCYAFKEMHPQAHVFWIYGADPIHFEQGYQDIARRARIPGWDDQKTDKLKLVQEWLESEVTMKWLLVVDNADDTAMFYGTRPMDSGRDLNDSKHFARFLPRCSHGSVLVTTRDRRLGDRLSHRQGTVQIPSLTLENSKDLLRYKISDENWSEDDAMKLVKHLSFLPLAITQAAAFASENSLSISEYLEILINNEDDMKELLNEHLEDPRRDWRSENSVIRTWKLSFEQISRESPRAAEVLSLLATLDHHGAARWLLRKEGETETGFRTALGVLQAFSLITVSRGQSPVCKMHPLVALATQRWLKISGALQYWQTHALDILVTRFPGPGQQSFGQFPNMFALMPHTEVILNCEFDSTRDALSCARLLISTALFDLSSARYQQAFEQCERSLAIRESLHPSDHPETIESIQTLGETLLHRGELAAARNMLQRAISSREKSLGALHPDTLKSLSDMTITLLELNELEAAEETGQRALKGREEVLGLDHPDYLVSLNIIGLLYQLKRDYQGAFEITERVLRARKDRLGAECPDTLMTLNNLARMKYQMGDLDAANQFCDQALAGEERCLARNGYDIQVSLSNKAAVLAAQGRFQDAEDILRHVLEMREKSLGPTNPSTQFTIESLIDVLENMGDVKRTGTLRERLTKPAKGPQVGPLLAAGLLYD